MPDVDLHLVLRLPLVGLLEELDDFDDENEDEDEADQHLKRYGVGVKSVVELVLEVSDGCLAGNDGHIF